jgi:hypothetical protein
MTPEADQISQPAVPVPEVASTGLVRLPYQRHSMCPQSGDTLIMRKRGGGERRVPPGKWWINRNTPVGDDAELFERMPHDGYRYLDFDKLLALERALPTPK